MTELQAKPPYLKMLGIFSVAYILCVIGQFLLSFFLNFQLPSGVALVVVGLCAAFAGQRVYPSMGRLLTSAEKAKFSTLAVLVLLVITIVTLLAIWGYVGLPFSFGSLNMFLKMYELTLNFLLIIALITMILVWIVVFVFVNMMSKSLQKAASKQDN